MRLDALGGSYLHAAKGDLERASEEELVAWLRQINAAVQGFWIVVAEMNPVVAAVMCDAQYRVEEALERLRA